MTNTDKPRKPPRPGTAAAMATALAAAPQTAPVAPRPDGLEQQGGADAEQGAVDTTDTKAETVETGAQEHEGAAVAAPEGGDPGKVIELRQTPAQPLAPAAAPATPALAAPAAASTQPRVPSFARIVARATPTTMDPALHAMLTRSMDVSGMQLASTLRTMLTRTEDFDRAVNLARSQGYPEAEIEALCLKHSLDTPPLPG